MLVIGTRNLQRVIDRSQSLCPMCGMTRSCRHLRTRAFLTIYWIPTVPVGNPLEFVECDTCQARFPISSSDRISGNGGGKDHLQREAQFKLDTLAICCLIVAADGTFHPREIEALLEICQRLDLRFDRERLGAFCSDLDQRQFQPIPYLRSVRSDWSKEESVLVSQMAFLAASATGDLNAAQSQVLSRLPQELNLTDVEYRTAIQGVAETSA